jgi:hypothetical protein
MRYVSHRELRFVLRLCTPTEKNQRTMISLLLLSTIVAADPRPPVFPSRWKAIENITVTQGLEKKKDITTSYFELEKNRTWWHFSKPAAGGYTDMITQWANDTNAAYSGRQYYIDTNAKGDRVCQFWCEPLPIPCDCYDSLCSYDYKNKGKYVGNETIKGQTAFKWEWTENLGPIPMNKLTLWTVPYTATVLRMFRAVHPFGKPLGNTDIEYQSFDAVTTPFDDSMFDYGTDPSGLCGQDTPADDGQCPAGASSKTPLF